MTEGPRLIVVGDDPLARAGLAARLTAHGARVVGEAAPGDAPPGLAADAIVWDRGPAGHGPFPRFAELGAPVLVLVGPADRPDEALAAGARGLLFRDTPPDHLAAALSCVALGMVVVEESLARGRWRDPGPDPPEPVEPLTPREREVLQLLAQGLPNRAIAVRLGISEHTAKFHVNAILGKLAAATRTEAVAQALRLGLVIL
jgi:two-component system, NarL family, nitrate/nitrite response regulator NarL